MCGKGRNCTCIKMNHCFHGTSNVNVTLAGKAVDLAAQFLNEDAVNTDLSSSVGLAETTSAITSSQDL